MTREQVLDRITTALEPDIAAFRSQSNRAYLTALVRPKAERVLDALAPALDPDVCDWLSPGRDR